MKVMTILGTRPEIIRLSRIIPKLDNLCEHVLCHTGQNYDPKLNKIFFDQLDLREPDHYLEVKADTLGVQIGQILTRCEHVIKEETPDRLLILGDTNSALSSIVAKRMGIPVFHMEAGNRCYDDRVPEEVNRRIIDHASDVFMPYTERSRTNLLREGIFGDRIYVIGNPIFEVLNHFMPQVDRSDILSVLNLDANEYFLVTIHRAENVDVKDRLESIINSLHLLQKQFNIPVIISTHPHTKIRMDAFEIDVVNPELRFLEPFGLFDFIALEKNAKCVLSDSGTVQEECAILSRPSVTLRDVTERPETVECGSNILSGVDPESVLRCAHTVIARQGTWTPPLEYTVDNVSNTVINIILGYQPPPYYRFV